MTAVLTLSLVSLFPFLKQHRFPAPHSEGFKSTPPPVLSLGWAVFFLFYSPRPHLSFVFGLLPKCPLFVRMPPSFAPLHLAGPSPSCFFHPAVCVQGNYRSHASPENTGQCPGTAQAEEDSQTT